MRPGKYLNGKEIKKIQERLEEQFGCSFSGDYAYFQNEKKRIFLINKKVGELPAHLRTDKPGLYTAEIMRDQSVRLSKEGVQLLAQEAKKGKKMRLLKNWIALEKEEVKNYFQGMDLEKDLGTTSRLVLLSFQGDLFSCAKYQADRKIILNFLPKIHRGEVIL